MDLEAERKRAQQRAAAALEAAEQDGDGTRPWVPNWLGTVVQVLCEQQVRPTPFYVTSFTRRRTGANITTATPVEQAGWCLKVVYDPPPYDIADSSSGFSTLLTADAVYRPRVEGNAPPSRGHKYRGLPRGGAVCVNVPIQHSHRRSEVGLNGDIAAVTGELLERHFRYIACGQIEVRIPEPMHPIRR